MTRLDTPDESWDRVIEEMTDKCMNNLDPIEIEPDKADAQGVTCFGVWNKKIEFPLLVGNGSYRMVF